MNDYKFILGMLVCVMVYYGFRRLKRGSIMNNVAKNLMSDASIGYIEHICRLYQNPYSEDVLSALNSDNRDFINELLEQYKNYLSSVFDDTWEHRVSSYTSYGSKLSDEEFFVLFMCEYLNNHETDTYIKCFVLYELQDIKWFSNNCYDAKYELTDYGMLFHELHYVVKEYASNNKKIKKAGLSINIEGTEKILKSKTIFISKM